MAIENTLDLWGMPLLGLSYHILSLNLTLLFNWYKNNIIQIDVSSFVCNSLYAAIVVQDYILNHFSYLPIYYVNPLIYCLEIFFEQTSAIFTNYYISFVLLFTNDFHVNEMDTRTKSLEKCQRNPLRSYFQISQGGSLVAYTTTKREKKNKLEER